MKNKMIAVDIDGVLAEFDTLFDNFIQKALPDVGKPSHDIYSFKDRYPKHKNKISGLFSKFAKTGEFLKAEPLPGYEKVNLLSATILTKRPKSAAKDTFLWLREHGIKFENIIITTNKSRYIDQTAVILEDHPVYIMPFARAGVRCYLFDKEFNRGIKHENIIRVNGWRDINVKEIKEYAINLNKKKGDKNGLSK
jgi:uncharacterized HAD superfamily protein